MTLIHDGYCLDSLKDKGITYFAYTLLKGSRVCVSYVSSPAWLDVYKGRYINRPPIQKYIMSSRLKVLFWEQTEMDTMARQFIHERNNIVNASSSITLMSHIDEYLAAFTISSKNGADHLIKFVERDAHFLMGICQHYNNLLMLPRSAAHIPLTCDTSSIT
jgi:hypothetical protein